MISRTAKHALRAAVALARLPEHEYRGAAQLAEEVGAPQNYLGKLLKVLAAHGVVLSQKGFGGGFRLARPADAITLMDIVDPFDHVQGQTDCIFGERSCSPEDPCVYHDRAVAVREAFLELLSRSTLSEAASDQRPLNLQ